MCDARRLNEASGAGGDAAAGARAGDPISFPQSGQKRKVGSTVAPQCAQVSVTRAPHAWQNFFPAISSVPQLAQRT
jgi:hypothetical protein